MATTTPDRPLCPECSAPTEATGPDGLSRLCPSCGWDSSPPDYPPECICPSPPYGPALVGCPVCDPCAKEDWAAFDDTTREILGPITLARIAAESALIESSLALCDRIDGVWHEASDDVGVHMAPIPDLVDRLRQNLNALLEDPSDA